MKSVVISLVILVLIFCTIYISTNYINKTANELASNMEKILQSAEAEDWETVSAINNQNVEKWYKISNVYNTLMNHEEVDNISIYMEQIDKYIKEREKTDVLAIAGSLRFLFEHLPKKNKATLGNIF